VIVKLQVASALEASVDSVAKIIAEAEPLIAKSIVLNCGYASTPRLFCVEALAVSAEVPVLSCIDRVVETVAKRAARLVDALANTVLVVADKVLI
jgi:hypothetical protein